MKLGLCTDINSNNFENIKAAAECGYSYAELPAKSIAKLSHGGIKELKKKINSFGITAEALTATFRMSLNLWAMTLILK